MGKSLVVMPIRKSAKGRSSAGFMVSTDDTAKTKHTISPLVWRRFSGCKCNEFPALGAESMNIKYYLLEFDPNANEFSSNSVSAS
uniref:Uncharacterized protein n=1 Tax=Romanomermis culicivorax TaxID=13658 RepID=A0A915KS65_ROMCU